MVTSVVEVDRAQVMAYRVAAQQLDRRVGEAAELAVLDLGAQDTPFAAVPDRTRTALDEEAAHLADARGVGDVRVVWSD